MASESPCPVDYSSEFFKNALKSEIRSQLVNEKANACPIGMRVAWHASGTYNASDDSGGSNGATMRFEPEASDGANAGLHIVHDLLKPVEKKFPNVSVSDIWAMAGDVAVEVTGGPKCDIRLGRTDKTAADGVPPNGLLPDASQGADHLREVFGRMGFNDRDIVALSGAHTLGRCHKARSGFDGPWTANPLKFDNSYFKNLMDLEWTVREWDGPMQYQDPSGQFMMLPTDMALKTDPAFNPIAREFADDEKAFFDAFSFAYSRLLGNGCPHMAKPKELGGADEVAPVKPSPSTEFREQCMHGSSERAMECIKAGADANSLESNSGRTGLMKAAYWGHTHMMPILLDELKVNMDIQDSAGDTALHDAARFGHVGVVTALLAAGANKNITNKDNKTPAQVAADYGKTEMVALLN